MIVGVASPGVYQAATDDLGPTGRYHRMEDEQSDGEGESWLQ